MPTGGLDTDPPFSYNDAVESGIDDMYKDQSDEEIDQLSNTFETNLSFSKPKPIFGTIQTEREAESFLFVRVLRFVTAQSSNSHTVWIPERCNVRWRLSN